MLWRDYPFLYRRETHGAWIFSFSFDIFLGLPLEQNMFWNARSPASTRNTFTILLFHFLVTFPCRVAIVNCRAEGQVLYQRFFVNNFPSLQHI